jgi:hypothetical protein
MMIDAIERRPDLHVDEALAPIEPTLHWLLTFFLRGWVLADALGQHAATSGIDRASQGKYDDDGPVHSRRKDQASMMRKVSHRPLLPLHQHPTPPAQNASTHRLLPSHERRVAAHLDRKVQASIRSQIRRSQHNGTEP